MIDIFTASGSAPFAISLAFVAGLFALELASAILGGSILGVGADSPDADIDTDFDFSIETDTDIGVGADGDPSGLNATSSGIFTWIGARDVPFLIWLASFLTMFGLFGLIVQNMANGIFATTLPALIAVALVFMPALAITRIIANWVALIMPKTETTAMRAEIWAAIAAQSRKAPRRAANPQKPRSKTGTAIFIICALNRCTMKTVLPKAATLL